jgi:hypothetical protein
MEFKGTKQKWQISTNNEVGILISTHPMSRGICTIWKYDNNFLENQEAKSNALLIQKSPEMFEFLKTIVSSENTPLIHRVKARKLIKEITNLDSNK